MRVVLFLLLCSLNFYVVAQEAESLTDDWFIGGSLSFQNSNTVSFSQQVVNGNVLLQEVELSTSGFGVFPSIGKKISQHWIGGFSLGYGYNKFNNSIPIVSPFPTQIPITTLSTTISNTYVFGVFGRYIFNPDDKFNFYLSPRLSYTLIEGDSDQNLVSVGVSPGLSYTVSDRFRIISQITGLSYSKGDSNGREFSDLTIDFSLSNFRFGADILF